MRKEFLEYNTLRDNAIILSNKIWEEGFVPDVIYVLLRGGAYLGNIISEYYKIKQMGRRPVYYAAVAARSYTGIAEAGGVRIEGWTYNPEHLRGGDKVLLVDDIFDSGNTINAVAQKILSMGIPRSDLKIAVHDYKIKEYCENQTGHPVQPDYWCRQHRIRTQEEDSWIHYLSHELIGLTPEEKSEWYYKTTPELKKALD